METSFHKSSLAAIIAQSMPYAHQFSALASNLVVIIGQGGYAILFIFTLLEGVPVLGMAVPGHVTIIIAGFLAKIGTLDLFWVIVISVLGAILGDYIGYQLGRRYGMTFIDRFRPYFFVTDSQIEKARRLLANHTGKAMVIGRFTPATRALMPFLVGAGHTPAGKFWIFNLIGGVSWAVSSIFIGYIFGFGYHVIVAYIGRFVLVAIVSGLIIVWGYRFINTHFHIFRRYELFTLILNLLALLILAFMLQDAASAHPFMINLDTWVSSHVVDPNTRLVLLPASLVHLAYWVTTIGGTAVTTGLGVLLALWLVWKKKWRSAAIMTLSIASTAGVLGVMKEFFMRLRPDYPTLDILNHVNIIKSATIDPSFPSGHAGMAAAFFVVLAYLFAPKIKSWVKRELFLVICVLAIIAIGLSRLVLNVHWASDVIAGWALGAFLASGSILLVRYIGGILIKRTAIQSQ
jgi:undecaprenyl-diphosphatase